MTEHNYGEMIVQSFCKKIKISADSGIHLFGCMVYHCCSHQQVQVAQKLPSRIQSFPLKDIKEKVLQRHQFIGREKLKINLTLLHFSRSEHSTQLNAFYFSTQFPTQNLWHWKGKGGGQNKNCQSHNFSKSTIRYHLFMGFLSRYLKANLCYSASSEFSHGKVQPWRLEAQ